MKLTTFCLSLIMSIGLLSCNTSTDSTDTSYDDTESEETMDLAVKVTGEEVSYAADEITMNGYLAYNENESEPRPGVLIIHEWWGHNDYVRSRAEQLAELGYVAFALDMYGNGKTASHPDDAGKFSSAVMQNLEGAKARFTEAMNTLKNHPLCDSTKIAAIGYCFGGSVALSMANAGFDLDGVAAFHSGVQLPVMPEPGTLTAQVLVCNGADDPFIQPESVEAFKAAMDETGVPYEYHAYEGAVHAFTNPEADSMGQTFQLPLAYNAEADEQSWQELKDFLVAIF